MFFLAAALSALSTPWPSLFLCITVFSAFNLSLQVKFKLLEDWNVFHFFCTPSITGPQYFKSYKVFSHLSTEFDCKVRSKTKFDLEFSSRIILGERFRAKKLWFVYWLQSLQIVNFSFLFCRMGHLMTHFLYDLHCDKFSSQVSVLVLVNLSVAFDTNDFFLLSDTLYSHSFQDTKLFLYGWSLLLGFICWSLLTS